jgi:hypothetical protein
MTAVGSRPPARSTAEREMSPLLARYDIRSTTENLAAVTAYRKRTHRLHWYGVLGAVFAGSAGLLGSTGEGSGWSVATLLVGYLFGSTVAEAFSRQRRAAGSVHAASLVTRRPDRLVPPWLRVLPWVSLVPCLAAPLLIIGDHPTGVTRFKDHTGSGMAHATWFSTTALVTTAVLAASGLILWRWALCRLARRRLPADRPGAARLDLLMRALSARSISGTAAALGLVLLSGLASLSDQVLVSSTCTAVAHCHDLYSAEAQRHLIENVGAVVGVVGIVVFLASRRRRIDPALLGSVPEPSS